jgi:hypothetical protein
MSIQADLEEIVRRLDTKDARIENLVRRIRGRIAGTRCSLFIGEGYTLEDLDRDLSIIEDAL